MAGQIKQSAAPAAPNSGMGEMLVQEPVRVKVVVGRTRLALQRLLKLTPSSFLELDHSLKTQAEILVNDQVIAWGGVVRINGNYGIRIQRIASRDRRASAGSAA